MVSKSSMDPSAMPEELRLLLSIVGMEHAPDLPAQIVRSANINWNYFIELTRHHRVFPLVFMNGSKIQGLFPGPVEKVLHQDYMANTFQMLHFCAEMQKICIEFEKSGIRSLHVKGPLLAERLYGDISLRTCKDMDILVPESDLKLAEAALRNEGYLPSSPDPATVLSKSREHHLSYIHPQKKIQIELHWRLNWKTWSEPSFDELWAGKQTIPFKGVPVHSLGGEDLFLSLTTHGARHGWLRLRWLSDIDKLMSGKHQLQLDWKRTIQLLSEYRLQHIGAQALLLTSGLFGTPVHDQLHELKPNRKSYLLAKLASEYIQGRKTHQYSFSLVNGLDKLKYIVHIFEAKRYDMEMLQLPRGLRWLYIPLRPLFYMKRKLLKRQRLTREM